MGEAVKVLDSVAAKYGHQFEYSKALVGACAIDATGDPYPAETHAVCEASDVVLFGAIGDPKYDNNPAAKVRPEQGLLRMRKSLGLFANLRPLAARKRIVLAMLAAFAVLALYTFGKAVYDIGRNDGSRIATDHAGQVELSVKPDNNHNVILYLYGTDEE